MATGEHIETMPQVTLSAHNSGNAKQSADRAQAIASALAAGLLACGLPLHLVGCMTLPVAVASTFAAVAVAVAVGALSVVGPAKKQAPLALLLASAVALVLLLAVPDARGGLFSLYNGAVSRFDDVFGAYVGLVRGYGDVAASPLFGICFGVLAGAVCWGMSRLRATGITLLFIVLACGSSLRLSTGAGAAGCALGVAGWLTQCRYVQLRGSMCSMKSLVADIGINIATCGAAFLLVGAVYSPTVAVDRAHDAMWGAINEARYGADAFPEGDMAQAAHLNDDSGASLKITPNGTFGDDVLLRGFVGAGFANGRWSALDHTAYEGEWSGIMGWLSSEGLTPAMQRSAYDDAKAQQGLSSAAATSTIDVDAGGAYRGYSYVPYTARNLTGSNANLELDGSLASGLFGSRTYRLDMDDVASADVLDDASWLESSSSAYAQAESVYAAFAKQHYLDVPDDEAAALKRLVFNDATWNGDVASSEYAVISRVRTMMDTLASYTEDPQAAPTGGAGAFSSWFLEQARAGNSSYFATAATLAFRTQGIPARYVEGYRAPAGDLTGAALTDGSVTLDHRNAHAWCEIYLDGLGWTPVEVTPGFYTQAIEPDSVIDVGEAWSSGAGDQVLQTGSIAGQVDDKRQDGEDQAGAATIMGAVRGALVTLGIVAALVAAAFIQRAVRISRRKQAIALDDQAVAVPALYRYLTSVLVEAAPGFDTTKPLDDPGRVLQAFPQVDAREYRRVIELHQAFAFGGHTLKPNEMRTLRRFTERLHGMLPACANAKARLKRYFVSAL